MVDITSLKCPNCGSADTSVQQELDRGLVIKCAYCDTTSLVTLDDDDSVSQYNTPSSPEPVKQPSPKLPHGAAEFGIQHAKLPWVAAAGALVVYLMGWIFEDTEYFLATNAMIIWIGIVPLWLLGVALLWRANRQVWWLGPAISIPILLLHTAIPTMIRGHFNDDYLGIAAMFAGAALVGWLGGRWLHYGLRVLRFNRDRQGGDS